MKKILIILIAAFMILTGCGASPGNAESEPAAGVEGEPAAGAEGEPAIVSETIEWITVSFGDLQFDVGADWVLGISDYYEQYKFGAMPDPCNVRVFENIKSDNLADATKYTANFGASESGEYFSLNDLPAYEDKRIEEYTDETRGYSYDRFFYLLLVEKNSKVYTFDIFMKESGEDDPYPHPDIIYDHIKNSIN